MSDKGWIKTYRKILDCWLWTSKEPYDRRSAWMYLLLTANHSDKKIMFNGELITVKRGQILTSIRTLAEKWKWSYDKTLRFLRTIESDGMIEKESDNFRTLVTIVNYEVFQDSPNADRTPTSEQSSEQTSERISEQTSDKQEYKELKNVKNERINKESNTNVLPKKAQNNFVPPTVEEVEAYCTERRNGIDAQSFVDFYESKGWMVGKNKMKVWKAAVRTWENEKKKKMSQQQQTRPRGNSRQEQFSRLMESIQRGEQDEC